MFKLPKFTEYFILGILLSIAVSGCSDDTNEVIDDAAPPEIVITSPVNNAVLEEVITITAEASDDAGLKSVELYVDSILIDTQSPSRAKEFNFHWITSKYDNGDHEIYCIATDKVGNSTQSDSITITVNNPMFKAEFINYFGYETDQYDKSILFLADKNGIVLLDTLLLQDGTVKIYGTDDLPSLPDTVSITIINIETNHVIEIETFLEVEPTSWKWINSTPNPHQSWEITIDMENIPESSYTVISTAGRAYTTDNFHAPFNYFLPANPANLFIMFDTVEHGEMYKWMENVSGNQDLVIDLSDMKPEVSKVISIPYENYSARYPALIAGAINGEDLAYVLDRRKHHNEENSTLTVYYPENIFDSYYVDLTIREDGAMNGWNQFTFGEIPDEFTKIGADFDFVDMNFPSAKITSQGTYDFSHINWKLYLPGFPLYWDCYAPAGTDEYTLPQLPESFMELYPEVAGAQFTPYNGVLYDYAGIFSFDDYINNFYEHPPANGIVIMDCRTVRKYYNDKYFVSGQESEDDIIRGKLKNIGMSFIK